MTTPTAASDAMRDYSTISRLRVCVCMVSQCVIYSWMSVPHPELEQSVGCHMVLISAWINDAVSAGESDSHQRPRFTTAGTRSVTDGCWWMLGNAAKHSSVLTTRAGIGLFRSSTVVLFYLPAVVSCCFLSCPGFTLDLWPGNCSFFDSDGTWPGLMLMSNIVLLKAGDGHKLSALFLFGN